ncbi:PAS domain-containing response regulator [Salinigranum rubrum]|uniref:PAS domain-containing response regulator n=1 Tax=Salinigranum rubrum TaxID=755307 RepID=UPI001FE3F3AA|nr:PAS domain S-box protein [Salinigranum rubrum]
MDDEPQYSTLVTKFLTHKDDRFEVATETSASDGLERLQHDTFDCIVSDYQMPEMDGLEFLRAIREVHPNLPFVLFTGKGSEEIASDAITAGVTDYLQKRRGAEQYTILANRITNLVDRYQALRQVHLSHRVMETASEGLSLVEPDGTFSYVNPAFSQLFGYERDELLGTHWTVLYHNEEAERLEHQILPAVRETGYWSGETVRLTKQGDRLITDHRLAHTDADVIVCTAKDVTEERSASVEQRTTFDLFVDTIKDYVFVTLDHEGYITRWSEGAEQLKGYETEEILGEHLSKFFPNDNQQTDTPEQLLETARKDGSVTYQGWQLRKDGSRFWADVTISASYDDSGTLRGLARRSENQPNQRHKGPHFLSWGLSMRGGFPRPACSWLFEFRTS